MIVSDISQNNLHVCKYLKKVKTSKDNNCLGPLQGPIIA